MTGTGPSKKEFADLINQMMGRNVMNARLLEQILSDAKNSYYNRGLDGFLEYIRRLTQAPLSNEELKQMMKLVIDAGKPDRALTRLVEQQWFPQEQAEKMNRKLRNSSGNRKKK